MSDGSVLIDTKLDNKELEKGLSKISSMAKTAFKGVAIAVGTVATAIGTITVAATKAYAEYEQLAGGVDAMFGGMEKGAEQINLVMQKASTAYKDLTMSQNDYFNTFNSTFPLIKSSIKDQNKAIEVTNRMMTLESDLANTFGYSMETATNAINWALKGTYSYVDNLNIGIKGTKEGFEEAAKAAGYNKSVEKLTSEEILDVLEKTAGQYGVLGRTGTEASETIQGSLKMIKASWQDFFIALSKGEGIDEAINHLMESFNNVVKNIQPVIEKILFSLVDNLPKFLEIGGQLLLNITNGIINRLPGLIDTTFSIIETLSRGIINNLPQILQTGIQILVELINGIAQMIPTLIPQAIDCIITIVNTLLDNIDLIIDAGIELILGLAEGLIEALPRLIEKAPEIIQKLFDALVRNFPKIVKAGGELIGKLVMGIIGSIVKLVEVAPRIVSTIYDGIKRMWDEKENIGKYLIEGLWKGISGMAGWLADKVKSFASNILKNMKEALGIHSPSRLFRDQVGKYIALGVGEGFTDNIDSVYKDMKTAVDFETQKLSANLSTTATMNRAVVVNMNLDGNVAMDSTLVGRIVAPAVSKTIRTGGAY